MQNNSLKLKNLRLLLFVFSFSFLACPQAAYAHAFGQQYNLPVPFGLYAYGASIAVIASFLIIGFFVKAKTPGSYPKKDISKWGIVRFFKENKTLNAVKALSLILFLFTIISGLIGTNEPSSNFNMTFFWIIFVLGLTYTTFFLGNIFETLNPWKIIVAFLEKLTGKQKGIFTYPKKLGYYPALLFYFVFIWIELLGRVTPLQLSLILINYTMLNCIGYYLFGKEDWFEYCEFFGVFFSFLSRLAIVQKDENRVFLRPPFVGLFSVNTEPITIVPFIVFMLSSTAFDGFKETQVWWNIYFNLPQSLLNSLGDSAQTIIATLGILSAFLLFFLLYVILTAFLKMISQTKKSLAELLVLFAPSLLPIALVYNVAHYYTLLLIQGQLIIPLISDPLGKGWNIFGTANFLPNISIISTNVIWHSEVAIILIGHIAAVYIAHLIGLNLFGSSKKALFAQVPTLVLMVFYTVAGLWILSQPLTSGF